MSSKMILGAMIVFKTTVNNSSKHNFVHFWVLKHNINKISHLDHSIFHCPVQVQISLVPVIVCRIRRVVPVAGH